MTYDARRIAADYLAALTDSEARDVVAEARSEHAEMRAFTRQLFKTDDDRSPWRSPADRNH